MGTTLPACTLTHNGSTLVSLLSLRSLLLLLLFPCVPLSCQWNSLSWSERTPLCCCFSGRLATVSPPFWSSSEHVKILGNTCNVPLRLCSRSLQKPVGLCPPRSFMRKTAEHLLPLVTSKLGRCWHFSSSVLTSTSQTSEDQPLLFYRDRFSSLLTLSSSSVCETITQQNKDDRQAQLCLNSGQTCSFTTIFFI